MAKPKGKTIIRVCSRYECGKYKEDGKVEWVKPTAEANFNFWWRGQRGEQWEIIFTECPDCEKKRKEDEL